MNQQSSSSCPFLLQCLQVSLFVKSFSLSLFKVSFVSLFLVKLAKAEGLLVRFGDFIGKIQEHDS